MGVTMKAHGESGLAADEEEMVKKKKGGGGSNWGSGIGEDGEGAGADEEDGSGRRRRAVGRDCGELGIRWLPSPFSFTANLCTMRNRHRRLQAQKPSSWPILSSDQSRTCLPFSSWPNLLAGSMHGVSVVF
jgi:hypothetical protein